MVAATTPYDKLKEKYSKKIKLEPTQFTDFEKIHRSSNLAKNGVAFHSPKLLNGIEEVLRVFWKKSS
jgi:hypothetical protein